MEFIYTATSLMFVVHVPFQYEAAAVEAMDDFPNPSWRAVAVFGNLAIGTAANGMQNNSGVKRVDSVGKLLFHTFKLLTLIRLELPCLDLVHDLFSTIYRLPHAASVENLFIRQKNDCESLLF
jgi:hypothetical protein